MGSQAEATGGAAPVDVLIVTAIREERDAVKAVKTGALGVWTEERAPSTELRVERRSFKGAEGQALHVALICAEEMGGTQTAGVASPVIMALKPKCLAMCGVLAGEPKDTEFGDVIFANQLTTHDTGKRVVGGFEHATRSHTLDIRWVERARDFARDPGDALDWLKGPEWTVEQERAWLLDQFSRGFDPLKHRALVEECCKNYESIIETLLTEELVQPPSEGDPLTAAGKKHVAALRFKNPRWPALNPPRRTTKVHVAPIASGSAVQADEALWKELSVFARKALGVEMEAHSVGTAAELHQVDLALVMKGVMDHANKDKDDRFKLFAASASAECLLAFVRRYVPTNTRPGFDDLLTPGTATPPANPAPSQLLDARHQIVPWHERGRSDVLAELDAWADDATREVSVRLLHAEGGVGKTRLAIEWVRRRRAQHEVAGFLVRKPKDDWFERLCALGPPVLVVIDYAESRTDLGELLERVLAYASATGNKRRVRVLLLARNNGDWWASLHRRSTELRAWLDAIPPRELGPVAVRRADREEVFREAAQVFAAVRGRAPVIRPPISFDDARFERVLYLHMAALAAVEERSFETGTLMDVVLDHEERFWSQRGRESGDELDAALDMPLARQLVAAATLRGRLPDEATARELFGRLRTRSLDRSDERLLKLLHRVYERPDEPVFLPGLEPDLLGESMVLRVALPPEGAGASAGALWIDRVFVAEDDAEALRVGFTVLGRASANNAETTRPWLARLLAGPIESRALLALEAAKVCGRSTAFSMLGDLLAEQLEARGSAALGRALERSGLPEQTVSLRRVAEWATRAQHAALPLNDLDAMLSERARLANNRAVRLGDLGRREEALEAAREAVDLRRTLAERNPDAFLPDLAMSLNNLGNSLSNLGRREEALEAAREAVDLRRTLAERNPDAFLPDLAMSLNNLGNSLSNLGRREEALEAAREAVEKYRTLAERNPDAFLPDLAMSLNNLGIRLSNLGRREEALEAAREAVDLRRTLAERSPDAFLPNLAASLNNLGMMLSNLGRREEALEAAREAVEKYRTLAERNPDAFLPDLAMSLNNLGNRLSDSGRREEALPFVLEALDSVWPYFERVPQAFAQNTGVMLRQALELHQALGRDPTPALGERATAFAHLLNLAPPNS